MADAASAILDAKLVLEHEIAPPLFDLLDRYIAAWERAGGQIGAFDRMAWATQIELLLVHHYARVVLIMTGQQLAGAPELHKVALSMRHLESLRGRAKRQAELILRTIDRDLHAGMSALAVAPPEDGTENYPKAAPPGYATKAEGSVYGVTRGFMARLKAIAASTKSKLRARMNGIANVQTQPVAEEARVEVVPNDQANGRLEYAWNSLLDGRERPAHHEAHGQTIRAGDAFTVGGFQLRFPGDAAMGAPLSQIVNCRCYLTTTFVGHDGTRRLIHVGPSAEPRRHHRPGEKLPPKLRPTSSVTLNGTTRARVILGDGKTLATMRQPTPTTIEVLVDRRVVARASIVNGAAAGVVVDPKYAGQDIEGLIRRSVENSAARKR